MESQLCRVTSGGPGRGPRDRYLPGEPFFGEVKQCVARRCTRAQGGIDTDDVPHGTGEFEHSATTTSDQDRWVRYLDRLRQPVQITDQVVVAPIEQRLGTEETLDDVDGFGEPLHPNAG